MDDMQANGSMNALPQVRTTLPESVAFRLAITQIATLCSYANLIKSQRIRLFPRLSIKSVH
jgi:hypothetical protein